VNTAVLVYSLFDETHRELLEHVDLAILWFFAAEIGLRFKRAGRALWTDLAHLRLRRHGWLLFDSLVIAVALAPVGVDVSALRVVRLARLTHHVRHVSHLWVLDLLPAVAARCARSGPGCHRRPSPHHRGHASKSNVAYQPQRLHDGRSCRLSE
jgi:hypothetical protein